MRKAARADGDALAVGLDIRITDLGPLVHGRVPHRRVKETVVATLEDDVIVLAGVGAREPQPRHHRLGARIGKAHEFRGRHHLRDALGDFQLAFGRECEHPADGHALACRLIDAWIRIT